MNYSQVKNCKYSNTEGTSIDCEVLFDRLGWVGFTAAADDVAHSNEIYQRAKSGEFGDIADHVPMQINLLTLSEEEKNRNTRNRLLSSLDIIISNPLRWSGMTPEQQQVYANYRQALLDVPQQSGFPAAIEWPTLPT